MSLEIKVSSTAAIINSNFEELKSQLKAELKQYDLIVDVDSVKTANKMATAINKLKKEISEKRKAIIAELSAPFREFENQAKELEDICETSRQKLLKQTKVYEEEQKDKALKLLTLYKTEIETKYGIKESFEIEIPFDLAIASNLTKNGLSKKARDEIEKRVLLKKQLQEKINTRLLTLETICFRAGLQTPLTRANIQHFLFEESEDVYLDKLTSLIHNEFTRLEKAKQLKEEQEQRKKVIKEENSPAPIKEETKIVFSKYSHLKNMQEFQTPVKKAKAIYVVNAEFEVEASESLALKLEPMLIQRFKKAEFKQIPKITIIKKQKVA